MLVQLIQFDMSMAAPDSIAPLLCHPTQPLHAEAECLCMHSEALLTDHFEHGESVTVNTEACIRSRRVLPEAQKFDHTWLSHSCRARVPQGEEEEEAEQAGSGRQQA